MSLSLPNVLCAVFLVPRSVVFPNLPHYVHDVLVRIGSEEGVVSSQRHLETCVVLNSGLLPHSTFSLAFRFLRWRFRINIDYINVE